MPCLAIDARRLLLRESITYNIISLCIEILLVPRPVEIVYMSNLEACKITSLSKAVLTDGLYQLPPREILFKVILILVIRVVVFNKLKLLAIIL